MSTPGFTVAGSTLSLLDVSEQGVVTRIKPSNDVLLQHLTGSGIVPGDSITLKQRSPMVLIRLGNQKLPLSVDSSHAVYVRLIKHPQPVSQPRDGGQRTVSALLTLLPLP